MLTSIAIALLAIAVILLNARVQKLEKGKPAEPVAPALDVDRRLRSLEQEDRRRRQKDAESNR